jgi:hypothetical protein
LDQKAKQVRSASRENRVLLVKWEVQVPRARRAQLDLKVKQVRSASRENRVLLAIREHPVFKVK